MSNDSVACDVARAIAEDAWMTAAHAVQLTLCAATVVAIAYVFLNRKISQTAIHVNLKVRAALHIHKAFWLLLDNLYSRVPPVLRLLFSQNSQLTWVQVSHIVKCFR